MVGENGLNKWIIIKYQDIFLTEKYKKNVDIALLPFAVISPSIRILSSIVNGNDCYRRHEMPLFSQYNLST